MIEWSLETPSGTRTSPSCRLQQQLTANRREIDLIASADRLAIINHLTPTDAIWVHPMSDRAKPSFVIFDIRAL